MSEKQKRNKNENKEPVVKEFNFNFNSNWLFAILGIIGLFLLVRYFFPTNEKEISREEFLNTVLPSGDVERIVVINNRATEVFINPDSLTKPFYKEKGIKIIKGIPNSGPQFKLNSPPSNDVFESDIAQVKAKYPNVNIPSVDYQYTGDYSDFIMFFLFIGGMLLVWFLVMRRMSGGVGGGGQIFNIGKSKATLVEKGQNVDITFNDVAGLDEAKEEVVEIVDFLKNPAKYTKLGGKIPKGVLLVGPPGTGKTLLAKAMAGEAQVPFFSISGSDFVEMFVGVGASRVRDLFKQAREKAPCVIFIDEIDAIGRARGKSLIQGNDERESTLNQLLVEMDGFSGEKGVIMLAATNRPDVLDTALLRPGRFDRQISIDQPDLKGREQIFKVHLKPLKTSTTLDAHKLAEQTPGFVGADIANICNEAALIAARRNKEAIDMDDFNFAIDRVIGGLEKKNKIILPDEKRIIAYHEAGHAICGWFLEFAHPLVKVSIVPRGVAALGYAQYLPKEKYIERTEEMLDRMCMTLGGRAAEEVVFGKISTGAQNDLDRITQMAYAMTVIYGMNDKVGNVSYYEMMNQNNFNKPFSEETAALIDKEVRSLIDSQFERAKKLLSDKRNELEILAEKLLETEVLHTDDLIELIGPRPYDKKEELGENTETTHSEENA